jgi:hypothetical protein
MGPTTDAVLYRCIGCRWYVIQGHLNEEYGASFYQQHGPSFAARDDAIEHAKRFAARQGINEIVEDIGAGDSYEEHLV